MAIKKLQISHIDDYGAIYPEDDEIWLQHETLSDVQKIE